MGHIDTIVATKLQAPQSVQLRFLVDSSQLKKTGLVDTLSTQTLTVLYIVYCSSIPHDPKKEPILKTKNHCCMAFRRNLGFFSEDRATTRSKTFSCLAFTSSLVKVRDMSRQVTRNIFELRPARGRAVQHANGAVSDVSFA